MSGLSRRIKQLDEELLALGEEAMLLEELDGFIAGLLACPELIMPGEWLPLVWHQDSADQRRPSKTLTMPTVFSVSSWSTTTMSRGADFPPVLQSDHNIAVASRKTWTNQRLFPGRSRSARWRISSGRFQMRGANVIGHADDRQARPVTATRKQAIDMQAAILASMRKRDGRTVAGEGSPARRITRVILARRPRL